MSNVRARHRTCREVQVATGPIVDARLLSRPTGGLRMRFLYLAGAAGLCLMATPSFAQSLGCDINPAQCILNPVQLTAIANGADGANSTDNDNAGGTGGNGGTTSLTALQGESAYWQTYATTNGYNLLGQANGGAGGAGEVAGADGGHFLNGPSPGGNGGQGGTVSVTNISSLDTTQNPSLMLPYINVTANGGNGGTGGDGAFTNSGASGGSGGSGGSATAENAGTASSMMVQANGGGGGSGGTAGSDSVAGVSGNGGNGGTASASNDAGASITAAYTGYSAAMLVTANGGAGGNSVSSGFPIGGNGGTGGTATVTNAGTIIASGNSNSGIWASADGAAGGNGTMMGGTGGVGGTVTITTTAGSIVTTSGASSYGLYAEANGGVFGTGGSGGQGDPNSASGAGGTAVITAAGVVGTSGSNSPAIGVFATGGAGSAADTGSMGGAGGAATANVTGTVSTTGASGSPGVWVQSLGGAGGGSNNGSGVSGGASGAATALLGSVSGTLTSIATTGSSSAAVWVVSQGGAGSVGADIQSDGSPESNYGGAGGNAGAATVMTYANTSLTTGGSNSPGLYVASLGGQGGDNYSQLSAGSGGSALTATASVLGSIITTGGGSAGIAAYSTGGTGGASTGSQSYNSWDQGGSGGTGGAAGSSVVTLGNTQGATASIQTSGSSSAGILATALGGAGGAGAVTRDGVGGNAGNGGNAGTVTVTTGSNTSIVTQGASSAGIVATSTGGAGGAGGTSSFQDGGAGGDGGAGNYIIVTLAASSSLATVGASSDGVQAISTAGSGGNGGSGAGLVVSSGGAGGTGGSFDYWNSANSNIVTVTNNGATITTSGTGSNGINAQTYGGFGGNGGGGAQAEFDNQGGNAGYGGQAGNVLVTNLGTITTQGDQSNGILAAATGGGGATGGSATSGGTGIIYTASVGGSGSGGGDGATVTVVNSGSLVTTGSSALGIFAQSVGGGGGIGGAATASLFTIGPAIAVAIGGSGGQGGNGGDVTVTNSGTISTQGFDSPGILALSVGGGGGTGGQSSSQPISLGMGDIPSVTVGISTGGSGGTGGTGGTVSIANSGAITTTTSQSAAIAAYSIGGGGGTGANATTQAYTAGTSAQQVSITVTNGGSGGTGGEGGTVTVTNTGALTTSGFASDGIYAVSVGGGGGNGGIGTSVTDTLALTIAGFSVPLTYGGDTYAINITVGGSGGSGNTGNTVTVTNSGTITTQDVDSRGILAQSIGGGGGVAAAGTGTSAGDTTVVMSVGGNGGSGGNGGAVSVLNTATGQILTMADGGHGIYAQSVGGGGGLGGTSSAETGGDGMSDLENDLKVNFIKAVIQKYLPDFAEKFKIEPEWPDISQSVNLSIGGSGGAAGNGGTVNVTNNGLIQTGGDVAFGIFAQSIGGGGGSGGASTVAGGNVANSNLGVGGSAGATGDGGTVAVTNSGKIITTGNASFGIVGQSGGGGGGVGALATAAATDTITVSHTIGGTSAVNANSGNSSAVGVTGDGGSVTITNLGSVTTSGAEAHGIVAQSIGAGGGILLINPQSAAQGSNDAEVNSALQELATDLANAGVDLQQLQQLYQQAISDASANFSLTISGSANSSGVGGGVLVDHAGAISTSGAGAIGILVQSIGGGGGLAADGAGLAIPSTVTGSLGGGSGNGGAVTVTLGSGSSIATTGTGAVGILAQSIGGGGGYTGALDASGATWSTFLANSTLGSGVGGLVSITMESGATGMSITTSGANAHGIFAQSLSGGGGVVAGSDGIVIPSVSGNATRAGTGPSTTSGGVVINLTGEILTTGANSVAIFAQSGVQGTTGAISNGYNGWQDNGRFNLENTVYDGGNIYINFTGTLLGGSGTGAAIQLDGGGSNQINIGAGSFVSALSGTALRASSGTSLLVENAGTISGNVDFSANASSMFTNLSSGVFNSGASVLLTGTAMLVNRGVLSPGGVGTIASTQLTGKLDNLSEGVLLVDVNALASTTSDYISVSGWTDLQGYIQPHVITNLLPGAYTILGTGEFIGMTATAQLPAFSLFNWTVEQVGSAVTISPRANFTPSGVTLSGNEASMAQHLLQTWNAGGTVALAPVYGALAGIGSAAAYTAALDSLSPENAHATAVAQTLGARTSLHASLSCPAFSGTGTLLAESSCAWARIIGGRVDQETSSNSIGYALDTLTYRVGMQQEILQDWFLGATAGFTQSWLSGANNLTDANGQSADASLALKHQVGPWLFALAGNVGFGGYDNTRSQVLGSTAWQTQGGTEVFTAGGRFRTSYELAFPNWYIRPYVDLDAIYTYMPGYVETGVGPLNLSVSSMAQWTFAVSPNVEFGARVNLSPEIWLRPYTSVGATFLSNDSLDVQASLTGVPGTVSSFTSSSALPDTLLNLGLGAQLFSTKGYELRLDYNAQLGSNYTSQEVSARFAVPF